MNEAILKAIKSLIGSLTTEDLLKVAAMTNRSVAASTVSTTTAKK